MPLMAGRAIVQNDTAADGLHGGVEPDNEAVLPLYRHRLRKAQLGKAGLARLQRIPLQQHHLGDVGGSPVVEVYRGAVLDDAVGILQIVRRTSSIRDRRRVSGLQRVSPRTTASRRGPARFTATRCPA